MILQPEKIECGEIRFTLTVTGTARLVIFGDVWRLPVTAPSSGGPLPRVARVRRSITIHATDSVRGGCDLTRASTSTPSPRPWHRFRVHGHSGPLGATVPWRVGEGCRPSRLGAGSGTHFCFFICGSQDAAKRSQTCPSPGMEPQKSDSPSPSLP